MRDDDGPGPVTHVSASWADEMRSGWLTWSSCGDLLLFLLARLVLGPVFVTRLGRAQDDVVDEPVLLRRLRGQEVVALGIERHLLDLLVRVVRKDLVELLARAKDFLGVNLDVGGLPLHAAPRLVDEEVRVRQRAALSVRTAGEQHRGHRVRHADADRRDRRADVLHGVVDGEARGHLAAWAVDVEGDLLVGVLRLQEQQLRNDEVCDLVVDRRSDENDALFQEPRVDVEGALSASRVLDHHRYEVAGRPLYQSHIPHNVILDRASSGSVKSLRQIFRAAAPALLPGEAGWQSSAARSDSSSAPPPAPSARPPEPIPPRGT